MAPEARLCGPQEQAGLKRIAAPLHLQVPEHGIVVDYPQGFNGHLISPLCNEKPRTLPEVLNLKTEDIGVIPAK
jgi:hypothetical protein